MLPIIARWRGARVEVLTANPITPAEPTAMAAILCSWLESYLRKNPSEIGPLFGQFLRNSPLIDNAADRR